MMMVDTSRLGSGDFVSTIPVGPAECCTDIGADYDDAVPEGAGIAVLFVVALAALAALAALFL